MKNKKGFTLVELLAVIVILGVLLLIAVPGVQRLIRNSKIASFESAVKLAIEGVERNVSLSGMQTSAVDCFVPLKEIELDRGTWGSATGYILVKDGKGYAFAYDSSIKVEINNKTIDDVDAEEKDNKTYTDYTGAGTSTSPYSLTDTTTTYSICKDY